MKEIKNPIAVYPMSNNMSINIYKIEFGFEDRVLAGSSFSEAEWSPIYYTDNSAMFKHREMEIVLSECLKV